MPDTTPAAQATPDAAAVAAAKATADAAAAAAAAKKPDGGQLAGGDTAGAAPAAPKVPDHYELSIPKGSEVFVDAADLEEIGALAKENGWTNEEAQGFLEDRAGALSKKLTAFRADTEADPVYGGAQLAESQQLAEQVLNKVRPKGHPRAESFRRLLTKTGIGNHIEMFSFLADLGKLMREDSPLVSSTSRGGGKRPPEEVLYGADKSA